MKRDRLTVLYLRAVGRGLLVPGRDDPYDPEAAWRMDRIAIELEREAALAEVTARLQYTAAVAACPWITHHSAGQSLDRARSALMDVAELQRPWIKREEAGKPSAEAVADWARAFGYEPNSPELDEAIARTCAMLDKMDEAPAIPTGGIRAAG